jgi:hypothetical protein
MLPIMTSSDCPPVIVRNGPELVADLLAEAALQQG